MHHRFTFERNRVVKRPYILNDILAKYVGKEARYRQTNLKPGAMPLYTIQKGSLAAMSTVLNNPGRASE